MKLTLTGYRPAEPHDAQELEAKLKCELPPDCVRFVREFDGATPEPNLLNSPMCGDCSVDEFTRVVDVVSLMDQVEGLPTWVIPVASSGRGNFVLLSIKPPHHVFFWDHEIDEEPKAIATSFQGVLDSLVPFDNSEVTLDTAEVISV